VSTHHFSVAASVVRDDDGSQGNGLLSKIMNRIICIVFMAIACASSPLRALADDQVDGVTLKDGKVNCILGDQLEAPTNIVKLPFEVEVSTNGTFTVAKGKERKLLEGQVIRNDGWLLNPDGSVQPVFDYVTMKGANVLVVRDGKAVTLTKPMTFPNNMNIAPDGSCVYPDGARTRLMDGQLFRLNGTPILSKDTITLIKGRVVVQKDGSLITLNSVQIMGMNDGTRVYGKGYIEKPDGTTIQLREGRTILVDGALVRH
jgi:hypothetical protein